jgi:hypothetical protein
MIVAGLLLSCSVMLGAWAQLNPGILGGVYAGVYFLPGQTQVGYACGTALDTASHMPVGLIVKTTDGGNTWMGQNTDSPNLLLAICFLNSDTGFACGVAGTILHTTDGGASWLHSALGDLTLPYVSFPSNNLTGYIGVTSDTLSARVYATTDGDSWSTKPVGDSLSRSTSCAMADDSDGVAFGLGGFLWGTADGFDTGKFLDPNTNARIVAGAFSRGDPNRAYIVGTDTVLHVGVVRYASSGSQQDLWDSVSCPVIPSFNCVEYASPETAYIGGASGFIGRTFNSHDFWRTNTGVTNQISSICFPSGPDTGYAAAGPVILRTYDAGGVQNWTSERESPAAVRSGFSVVANPCRGGIPLCSDVNVTVSVFDVAGRAVLRQAASKGLNFLSLRAGAYFVRAGAQTARAVVTD